MNRLLPLMEKRACTCKYFLNGDDYFFFTWQQQQHCHLPAAGPRRRRPRQPVAPPPDGPVRDSHRKMEGGKPAASARLTGNCESGVGKRHLRSTGLRDGAQGCSGNGRPRGSSQRRGRCFSESLESETSLFLKTGQEAVGEQGPVHADQRGPKHSLPRHYVFRSAVEFKR